MVCRTLLGGHNGGFKNPPRRQGVTEKLHKQDFAIERLPEPVVTAAEGSLSAAGRRFAIVVSRFNAFITERLLGGAIDGLMRSGAKKKDVGLVRVPGAFEIPLAARKLAETKKYDAIICLGCLLRGDTAHYDVIVNEVTRGIGQSAQDTGVPHAFGVLTCDTLEQAIDRAGLKMGNKGLEAALAAVEMASLVSANPRPASVASKKQVPDPRFAPVRNDNRRGTAAQFSERRGSSKRKPK
jgi:6,7-dimethyl-8-ribityllumazine synthase